MWLSSLSGMLIRTSSNQSRWSTFKALQVSSRGKTFAACTAAELLNNAALLLFSPLPITIIQLKNNTWGIPSYSSRCLSSQYETTWAISSFGVIAVSFWHQGGIASDTLIDVFYRIICTICDVFGFESPEVCRLTNTSTKSTKSRRGCSNKPKTDKRN